jgi:hypothetical protein
MERAFVYGSQFFDPMAAAMNSAPSTAMAAQVPQIYHFPYKKQLFELPKSQISP